MKKVEESYKELGCHNSTIETYMQGNLMELMATLQGRIANARKDDQYYQIEAILYQVKRDIEENLDDEEQSRRDNEIKYGIEETSSNQTNYQTTMRIINEVEDALRDVQSRQNRLLSTRGYNDIQIGDINYEMVIAIRQMLERGEESIADALKGDDAELKKQLLEKYEKYISERQENSQTKEANFRESLDVGISLEEQKENVLQFQKSEETKREDDKNLHSQSLPELFK